MVEIQVFIEGAVLPNEKHSAQTMDNSHRFREGFRKLFSKAFEEEDLKIIVQNGSGITQTVNFFKQHATAVPGVLNTILSRYFRVVKNGTVKKLKYHGGKLKIAPDLIERLDFNALRATFEDVDRLYLKITASTITDAEET